jgi:hypothetical protein
MGVLASDSQHKNVRIFGETRRKPRDFPKMRTKNLRIFG